MIIGGVYAIGCSDVLTECPLRQHPLGAERETFFVGVRMYQPNLKRKIERHYYFGDGNVGIGFSSSPCINLSFHALASLDPTSLLYMHFLVVCIMKITWGASCQFVYDDRMQCYATRHTNRYAGQLIMYLRHCIKGFIRMSHPLKSVLKQLLP